jgi:hypothetical protein
MRFIPASKHCRVTGTMSRNRRFLARDMLFFRRELASRGMVRKINNREKDDAKEAPRNRSGELCFAERLRDVTSRLVTSHRVQLSAPPAAQPSVQSYRA